MEKRQRADGSVTFTDPAWDERWYWPTGTRVLVAPLGPGVVVKQNSVSATVHFDDGSERSRVPLVALVRLEGGI